jgi:hypothetical protein
VGGEGYNTIIKIGMSAIKIMMSSKRGQRILVRWKSLKKVRNGGNDRSNSRVNSMVEESVKFARGKR